MSPERPLRLNAADARTPNVRTKQIIPDIAAISSQPRGCLEDAMQLPPNPAELFERSLFSFNVSLVPEASALYRKLGLPKKPLTLIEPQFEQPLPPLKPSVFPPRISEPPPPKLERFDLDDAFANEYFKVTQLTLTAQRLGRKARAATGPGSKGVGSKAEEEYTGVVEDYVSKAAQAVGIPGAAKMSPQQALMQVRLSAALTTCAQSARSTWRHLCFCHDCCAPLKAGGGSSADKLGQDLAAMCPTAIVSSAMCAPRHFATAHVVQ